MSTPKPNFELEDQDVLQSTAGKNQLKLLKVWDILSKHSDDQHQLSVKAIMNMLSAEGISSERKSIYQYIKPSVKSANLNSNTSTSISKRIKSCVKAEVFIP